MPKWWVEVRNVIALMEVEAETAEEAQELACMGRGEWEYDHGQTDLHDMTVSLADR